MDAGKFKEVENKYKELSFKLGLGEINADDMKRELKKMMIQDEGGSYWMIGGKTGKWYVYNGVDWKEDIPYKEDPIPARSQPVVQEEEEDILVVGREDSFDNQPFSMEREETIRLGGTESPLDTMAYSAGKEETQVDIEPTAKEKKLKEEPVIKPVTRVKETSDELVVTAINMVSLIFFLGGIGIIAGVLFGATFGIFTSVFGDLIEFFPEILQGTQGGLAGGLIFAALGGIGGFVLFALAAMALSSIYNLIAFIFGGIRFKIK